MGNHKICSPEEKHGSVSIHLKSYKQVFVKLCTECTTWLKQSLILDLETFDFNLGVCFRLTCLFKKPIIALNAVCLNQIDL